MPSDADAPELVLTVVAEGAGDDYRYRLTSQLLEEVQHDLGLDARRAAEGEVPERAKAVDAMAIATLVMPLLVAVAPKLIDLLKEWATRGEGCTLKITVKSKKNKEVVIEYNPKRTSPDELQKLIKLAQQG